MTLKSLFEAARAAQGVRAHFPVGYTEPSYVETVSKLRRTVLDLCNPVPNIAAYFDSEGKLLRIPNGRSTVASASIDPLVVARAHSRFAAAGAHLIVRSPAIPPKPSGSQGIIVMQREVSGLSVIQPLKMVAVADNEDTPVLSSLPIASAAVDWSDEGSTPAYGVRLEIPRGDYRDHLHNGTLDEVLTVAILAGAGRIADQALMTALDAASLGNFSLANAAAAGLGFQDLRAVIGTSAVGAAVGQDGVLRASGIAAELTDTGASTFVGAFDQAAVMLDREVRVIAEKTNRDGALAVTVFSSAAALLPDPTKFWKVVA